MKAHIKNSTSISPSFSVIVSTYHRPDFLDILVESILSQTLQPIEVIVVEGGDADSFLATQNALSRWVGQISVVLCAASTLGESRNYGVTLARGNWCAFSDDDDLWHPEKLAVLANLAMDQDVISHGYHRSPNPAQRSFGSLAVRGKAIERNAYSLFLHFLGNRYGGGSSLSARTVTCKAIRFDETMSSCEDIEWIIRCLLSGSRMGFIQRPLVIYRQHAGRMTGKQRKVALWEMSMVGRFLYIPVGFLFGIVAKLLRSLIRLFISR